MRLWASEVQIRLETDHDGDFLLAHTGNRPIGLDCLCPRDQKPDVSNGPIPGQYADRIWMITDDFFV